MEKLVQPRTSEQFLKTAFQGVRFLREVQLSPPLPGDLGSLEAERFGGAGT